MTRGGLYRREGQSARRLDPSHGHSSAISAAQHPLHRLQEAAGNRAIAQRLTPIVQRHGPNHDNWAFKETTKKKNAYVTREGTADWGEFALHHKISKVVLQNLYDAAAGIPQGQRELKEAAGRFISAMDKAVDEDTRKEGGPPKSWWNMALNLEIGPQKVVGDPGIGFDPSTEGGEGGRRQLEPVSRALQKIDDIYQKQYSKGFKSKHWKQMAQAIAEATELHRAEYGIENLAPPRVDQWVSDERGAFQRKGLRTYRGIDHGLKHFKDFHQSDLSPIATLQGDNTALYTATLNPEDNTGLQSPVAVQITGNALYHTLRRHTYHFFSFTTGDIKAMNTFFDPHSYPDPSTNLPSLLQDVILPKLARIFAERIRNTGNPDLMAWEDEEINASNQKFGGDSYFYIMNLSINDDTDRWLGTLKTLAPDGANSDAYTSDELNEIRARANQQAPHAPT